MIGSEAAKLLDEAWSSLARGATTYPRFVLAFEVAVQMVEEDGDPLAHCFRRIWGQVEIINALALDASVPVSLTDLDDTRDLVGQARDLLESEM